MQYVFIIDTDSYSGNFERDMCAYITGRVGECTVGDDMADAFIADGHKPFANVIDKPDSGGCWRPCAIWPTLGYYNHGQGGFYEDIPENDELALADYKRVAIQYEQKYLNIYQSYVTNPPNGWTKRQAQSAVRRQKQAIMDIQNKTSVTRWPAYMSVAIFFRGKPTDAQIELMKRRSQDFARCEDQLNVIIGYRLEPYDGSAHY